MSVLLTEDKRNQLMAQGRRGAKEKDGKSRYEKRVKSKVASVVRSFNEIDMNSVFKYDILTINVPVTGETDNYTVRIKFGGFLELLRRQIERQDGILNLRAITRALLDAFNQEDVFIHCSCLHPDTKIKLLDGTEPTVQEMCQRFEAGEKLYCYSVDARGDFIPGEVEKVWVTGQATELVEVTLDNGERIQTTPDHLYMLRDGTYLPAAELREGQSLMPLYFGNMKGYETIRYNSHKGCNSTYKMVAAYFKSDEIKEAELRAQPDDGMSYKVAIHHKDFHKENNTPENLQVMAAKEHWMYHASLCGPDRPISDRAKEISRQNAIKRNANPTPAMIEAREKWREAGRARNYDPDRRQQQSEIMRENMAKYYAEWTEEERAARSALASERTKQKWREGCFDTPAFKNAASRRGEFLHSPEIEAKSKEGHQKWWEGLSEEEREPYYEVFRQNIKKAQDAVRGVPKKESIKQRMSQARLNESSEKCTQRIQRCAYTKIEKVLRRIIDQKLPLTIESYKQCRGSGDPNILKHFSSVEEAVKYFQLNHKVTSIRRIHLETPIDVYDIKMRGEPNFLVSAGVILHNCPDWTYRFSYWSTIKDINSGPPENRPAKITNPKNDLGPGCKHVMLVLSNNSWLIKVASVINNYIIYFERNRKKDYADIIYPAIYGHEYQEPVQLSIDDNQDMNDQELINKANELGRTRGQFKAGNPYRYQPRQNNQAQGQMSFDDEPNPSTN